MPGRRGGFLAAKRTRRAVLQRPSGCVEPGRSQRPAGVNHRGAWRHGGRRVRPVLAGECLRSKAWNHTKAGTRQPASAETFDVMSPPRSVAQRQEQRLSACSCCCRGCALGYMHAQLEKEQACTTALRAIQAGSSDLFERPRQCQGPNAREIGVGVIKCRARMNCGAVVMMRLKCSRRSCTKVAQRSYESRMSARRRADVCPITQCESWGSVKHSDSSSRTNSDQPRDNQQQSKQNTDREV